MPPKSQYNKCTNIFITLHKSKIHSNKIREEGKKPLRSHIHNLPLPFVKLHQNKIHLGSHPIAPDRLHVSTPKKC